MLIVNCGIFKNSNGYDYEILIFDSTKNIALLKRENKHTSLNVEYVVAKDFSLNKSNWGSGVYFNSFYIPKDEAFRLALKEFNSLL